MVYVNGFLQKEQKIKLEGGERIQLTIKATEETTWQRDESSIARLNIVYEDDEVIVINKPRNMVSHPGANNLSGTVANALLAYNKCFSLIVKAGMVHRLDKDTSGLMMIAKTDAAYIFLTAQIAARKVVREYLAVVEGRVLQNGTIKTYIARNSHNRLKMAVSHAGKEAITHFEVLEYFKYATLLKCKLDTGRTHQIRVHMQHLGFPIVGDILYGSNAHKESNTLTFNGQALHAKRLMFVHPKTQKTIDLNANLPESLEQLIVGLRNEKNHFS